MSDGGTAVGDELTVLFVDDYPEYVTAGTEYLERVDDGITVLPETDPEAALSRLARESVDCVVCDYEMPEMDGVELLEAARRDDPELPVVLLTGHDTDQFERAVGDDATAVLQKGSGAQTFEQLRATLREVTAAEAGVCFDNVTS